MSDDRPPAARTGRSLRKGALTIFAVPAAIAVPLVATDLSARDSGSARAATTPGLAQIGEFSPPFVEPTIGPGAGYPRVKTSQPCIERPNQNRTGTTQTGTTRGFIDCKPTAGTQSILPGGKVLYWDNLAGTENVEFSILSEYGVVGVNDQSRLLDPVRHLWGKDPSPLDGGGENTNPAEPLIPGQSFSSNETGNDASLFCADQNFLSDGRLIASGGTKYLNDPGNDQTKFGSTELEGVANTRIYDPKTNRWTQSGHMNRGRWYETMTTLPNGHELVVSGLRKLVKAFNRTAPIDPQTELNNTTNGYAPGYGVNEGQNERTTETFDPKKGKWTLNPPSARRSLPLFARTHLLPDGKVFYNPVGQSYNPQGQAYDEALWNIAAVFDPKKQKWADLGIPGLGVEKFPGFRGSTFSVMMPLTPGADGRYSKAHFLVGGGEPAAVLPSPGAYATVRDSDIRTIDTAQHDRMTVNPTGDMIPFSATEPTFGRWYGTGTLLPTGQVLATSGSDRDEVAVPGLEIAQRQAELFDPTTKTWHPVAMQHQQRTYHNTANLLPDATVLVGGHAIISNGYLANRTVPGGVTAPNGPVGRDPTFEVYKPPYMFCPGKQAHVTGSTQARSRQIKVTVDVPASSIQSVSLVRNGSLTHEVDADQRTVDLKILSRKGNVVTVQGAPNSSVLPPGPYMLFANRSVQGCVKPSVARQVMGASDGQLVSTARPPRHVRRHLARPRFTG